MQDSCGGALLGRGRGPLAIQSSTRRRLGAEAGAGSTSLDPGFFEGVESGEGSVGVGGGSFEAAWLRVFVVSCRRSG